MKKLIGRRLVTKETMADLLIKIGANFDEYLLYDTIDNIDVMIVDYDQDKYELIEPVSKLPYYGNLENLAYRGINNLSIVINQITKNDIFTMVNNEERIAAGEFTYNLNDVVSIFGLKQKYEHCDLIKYDKKFLITAENIEHYAFLLDSIKCTNFCTYNRNKEIINQKYAESIIDLFLLLYDPRIELYSKKIVETINTIQHYGDAAKKILDLHKNDRNYHGFINVLLIDYDDYLINPDMLYDIFMNYTKLADHLQYSDIIQTRYLKLVYTLLTHNIYTEDDFLSKFDIEKMNVNDYPDIIIETLKDKYEITTSFSITEFEHHFEDFVSIFSIPVDLKKYIPGAHISSTFDDRSGLYRQYHVLRIIYELYKINELDQIDLFLNLPDDVPLNTISLLIDCVKIAKEKSFDLNRLFDIKKVKYYRNAHYLSRTLSKVSKNSYAIYKWFNPENYDLYQDKSPYVYFVYEIAPYMDLLDDGVYTFIRSKSNSFIDGLYKYLYLINTPYHRVKFLNELAK